MFKFDWSRFDAKLGLIFTAGVLVVSLLAGRFEFSIMAAGISALLAWITVILVPDLPQRQHILGLLAYLIVGIPLVWLAEYVAPFEWGRPISMAAVTFAGYMVLMRGVHPFMVGWCLAYLYLLVPLFFGDAGSGPVVIGHVVGVVLVIFLNLLKPVWKRAVRKSENDRAPVTRAEEELPPTGFVVRFAATVSAAIFAGMVGGMRLLPVDPIAISNATINMISPTLQQTWVGAVERVSLGSLGLLSGFCFGWFFPEPWVGTVVTLVFSFLAVGMLRVNFALLAGLLFFMTAYPWGALRSDLGHQLGNAKLIGEFLGVVIAVIAIAVLHRMQTGKWTSDD